MARQAVNLEINARDRTRRAFETATRRLDDLTGGATRLNKLFAGGLGAAAVGGALAGISRAVQQAVADLDALGKAAVRAGTDAEVLQGVRQFAERVGVGINTANTAMQRFNRRVGDARRGTGTLLPVLERFGIELNDVGGNARSTIDILSEFQDGLRGLATEQERASIAGSAFDVEGVGFGLGLANATENITEFIDRAKAFGVVVSNEMVAEAEALTDSFTTLGEVVRAKTLTAIEPLTGELREAADALLVFLNAADETTRLRVSFDDLDDLREDTEAYRRTAHGLFADLDTFTVRFNDAFLALREGVLSATGQDQIAALEQLETELAKVLQTLVDSGQGASAGYQLVVDRLTEVQGLLEAARADQEQSAKDAEGQAKATKDAAEYAEFVKERQEASAAAYKVSREEAEKLAEIENQRQTRALAALATEERQLERAIELVDLSGRDLLIARQRHREEDLLLRIDEARKKERTDEVAALERLLELERERGKAALDAHDAQQKGTETVAEQNDLLRDQLAVLSDIGYVLDGFEDSTEGWIRALGQALQIWQQFSAARSGEGTGGVGGLLGGLGGAIGGGGAIPPVPAVAPSGRAPVGAQGDVVVNNVVHVSGANIDANFRRLAIEAADLIHAGQQDFLARVGR